MKNAGCRHAPGKLFFGTGVGLECRRLFGDEDVPPFEKTPNTELCEDKHG